MIRARNARLSLTAWYVLAREALVKFLSQTVRMTRSCDDHAIDRETSEAKEADLHLKHFSHTVEARYVAIWARQYKVQRMQQVGLSGSRFRATNEV